MRLLLDACVLYPTLPREILLGLAATGWAAPLWSARILEEWRRAVLRNLPKQADQVAAEIAAARARFPAGEIAVPEGATAGLSLPDPDDLHVLAAALAGRADAIVTFNLRDFPGRALARHDLLVRHPDALLVEAYHEDPDRLRAVLLPLVEPLAGADRDRIRPLLKRARLPRLGKALAV